MHEHCFDFILEDSRYAIWRQGEWAFFIWCSASNPQSLHLHFDVLDPDLNGIMHPQGFELPLPGDELDFEIERDDGTVEVVTICYEQRSGQQVRLTFQLPDGVQMEWHQGARGR